MTRLLTSPLALAAALGALTVTGCSSAAPTAVPASYLQGTPLDRNPITVAKRTEFLEIDIHPEASQLSLSDKARIQNFVASYRSVGHGPLIMSLPESSSNPQLAVSAVAEAREIAWENGVEYEEISGSSHGAESTVSEPMILAYKAYDVIAPDCPSLASLNMADISSNNELPTLGCSIRTNLAAMISDPGDLLGQRALDEGDPVRRSTILGKFREGESTGAERSDAESGSVSTAVGN